MKTIADSTRRNFGNLFIIGGFGTLILSVVWLWSAVGDQNSGFSSDSLFMLKFKYVAAYYFFNSLCLLVAGFLFKRKSKDIFSFISAVLFISVLASLLIVDPGIGATLFSYTTVLGFAMIIFGGPIFVPLFLLGVGLAFVWGVMFISGFSQFEQQLPITP